MHLLVGSDFVSTLSFTLGSTMALSFGMSGAMSRRPQRCFLAPPFDLKSYGDLGSLIVSVDGKSGTIGSSCRSSPLSLASV